MKTMMMTVWLLCITAVLGGAWVDYDDFTDSTLDTNKWLETGSPSPTLWNGEVEWNLSASKQSGIRALGDHPGLGATLLLKPGASTGSLVAISGINSISAN